MKRKKSVARYFETGKPFFIRILHSTDTLDFSQFDPAVNLDLNLRTLQTVSANNSILGSGSFSTSKLVLIENVIGSQNGDTHLGGLGSDTLYGGEDDVSCMALFPVPAVAKSHSTVEGVFRCSK